MHQRILQRVLVVLLAGALTPAMAAETVSRIRLLLHPYIAAPGQLPPGALVNLQALAGVPLTFAGATRTGSLEFNLPQPLDAAAVATMVSRMREDRSVVWAEPVASNAAAKSVVVKTNGKSAPALTRQKLMLRLAPSVLPDWPTLLPRFSAVVGATLTVDHQIGNIWVLTLDTAVPDAQLANMASQLETDAMIQYADPVQRAVTKVIPNDPDYNQEWALSDPVAGINAPAAWDLQKGNSSIAIAVVDTGITTHPELAGRVLPGYDFISDPARSGDGDGRDNDPSDNGDSTSDGQCFPGSQGEPSSWHGTFVSGIIAANTNNGVGIAGIDWHAMILPVRVLGKCGGTFDDITAGVLWAAGLPVTGVPANPYPARVINMSLGGSTDCPQAMQDAINQALSEGIVVAVAAGNESDDASTSAPANCSGVITVGGSTRQGDRTDYSNFGARVDISAPGGDGDVANWIFSISNDGTGGPGNPTYKSEIGTSFSAPQVAGTASLMFARNANLTPGRVLNIMSATSRAFPAGTTCAAGGACGAGLLDAGFALQSTPAGDAVAPSNTVPVIEYYRADKDHYFMSANAAEIAFTDTVLSGTFQRTGELFYAWTNPALAPNTAKPVCRFYSRLPLIDSHFYTAIASECQYVLTHEASTWTLENPAAFYVLLPDATGACPASTAPVYRFFDNRNDANQRHTIDLSVQRAMINRGWVPEGSGPNAVAFCTPD
jgi:serine protease